MLLLALLLLVWVQAAAAGALMSLLLMLQRLWQRLAWLPPQWHPQCRPSAQPTQANVLEAGQPNLAPPTSLQQPPLAAHRGVQTAVVLLRCLQLWHCCRHCQQ